MAEHQKSSDHFILIAVLAGIILSTPAAYAVYNYERNISPWFYTVSFGDEVNSTNGGFKIIFKPEITHNQNNDTIIFKAKVINIGSKPIDLNWGEGSFRIRVFDKAGIPIPDSPASQQVITIGYYRNLNPGEGVDFDVNWKKDTYFIGEMRFTPGTYYVSGILTGVIESSRVEMVLSPNDRTAHLFGANAPRLWVIAGLGVFGVVIWCALLIRRLSSK